MKNLLGGMRGGNSQRQDQRLLIYCAGGQGRESLKTARAVNRIHNTWNEIFFIDDGIQSSSLNGVPVMTFCKYLEAFQKQDDCFHIAAGEPVLRRRIAEKLLKNFKEVKSIIHPGVVISPYCVLQEGVFIGEGVMLSDNLTIGKCACLNAGAIVGHNAMIGDYATVSPGAIISGDVTIGEGTYIGTGAIIRDEVKIGKDCIIGMGSLVTKDIPDGVVAFGSPCRVIRKNQDGIVFRPLSKMEISPNGGGGGVNYPYNGFYLLFAALRKAEAAA